jgi:hypothetical protein
MYEPSIFLFFFKERERRNFILFFESTEYVDYFIFSTSKITLFNYIRTLIFPVKKYNLAVSGNPCMNFIMQFCNLHDIIYVFLLYLFNIN